MPLNDSLETADRLWHSLGVPQSEHGAALAERRVREAEGRVARQAAVVERFEAAGDALVAEKARDALIAMRVGLAIAHLYWLVELAAPDDKPDREPRD